MKLGCCRHRGWNWLDAESKEKSILPDLLLLQAWVFWTSSPLMSNVCILLGSANSGPVTFVIHNICVQDGFCIELQFETVWFILSYVEKVIPLWNVPKDQLVDQCFSAVVDPLLFDSVATIAIVDFRHTILDVWTVFQSQSCRKPLEAGSPFVVTVATVATQGVRLSTG